MAIKLAIFNRLSAPKFFHSPYPTYALHRTLPLPWRPRCWRSDCSWRSGKYLVLVHRHLETVSMSISDLNRQASQIGRIVSSYTTVAWMALGIAEHSLHGADDMDRVVQPKTEVWQFCQCTTEGELQ